MKKKTKEDIGGGKVAHTTHSCCNKRLTKEGGKARCCYCVPHSHCEFKKPKEMESTYTSNAKSWQGKWPYLRIEMLDGRPMKKNQPKQAEHVHKGDLVSIYGRLFCNDCIPSEESPQGKGEEIAHPTEEGYCCACDYDIACFKEEIAKATADEARAWNLGLQNAVEKAREQERQKLLEKLEYLFHYTTQGNLLLKKGDWKKLLKSK